MRTILDIVLAESTEDIRGASLPVTLLQSSCNLIAVSPSVQSLELLCHLGSLQSLSTVSKQSMCIFVSTERLGRSRYN